MYWLWLWSPQYFKFRASVVVFYLRALLWREKVSDHLNWIVCTVFLTIIPTWTPRTSVKIFDIPCFDLKNYFFKIHIFYSRFFLSLSYLGHIVKLRGVIASWSYLYDIADSDNILLITFDGFKEIIKHKSYGEKHCSHGTKISSFKKVVV